MEEYQKSTDLQERINRRNNRIDVVMKESPEGEVSVTFKTSWVVSWLRFKSWKGSILLYAEILMGINTCTVCTAHKSAKVDTLQFNGSIYMCSLHRNAHSLSCSIPKEMHLPVPPMQWNYKTGHQRSSSLKVRNAHYIYIHTYKVDMRSSRKKSSKMNKDFNDESEL